ncbi:helix-turn-helix transcriptional regulator [Pseudovibrio japonicus]|uniref:helix-turn-helix transcriptional regulator n=1 Tax=Pseudovibrio japonicus TaxID=366534 RepID=UPI00167483F4|nr:helix-turn-helix domain-containing protein [Pseudovibrio japonicus]
MTKVSLLTAQDAAKYLTLSPSTLAKMRLTGASPKFIKLGRRVAYRIEDLDLWVEKKMRSSTSE